MELAEGEMLSDYHKRMANKRLSEKESGAIFKQIVKGMEYCHQNLVFHRDLKTENIMIAKNKKVKIIDFGFSVRQKNLGKLNLFCGTPNYMSPELILKKEYFGGPSDVWALGVMLFRICSGRFPFVGNIRTLIIGKDDKSLHKKIINIDFKHSSSFAPDLIDLLDQILVYDPKKRPTCSQILEHRWFLTSN